MDRWVLGLLGNIELSNCCLAMICLNAAFSRPNFFFFARAVVLRFTLSLRFMLRKGGWVLGGR